MGYVSVHSSNDYYSLYIVDTSPYDKNILISYLILITIQNTYVTVNAIPHGQQLKNYPQLYRKSWSLGHHIPRLVLMAYTE